MWPSSSYLYLSFVIFFKSNIFLSFFFRLSFRLFLSIIELFLQKVSYAVFYKVKTAGFSVTCHSLLGWETRTIIKDWFS